MTNRFPTESDDIDNYRAETSFIRDNNIDPRFMTESDDLDLSRFRTHNNIPEPKSKTVNSSSRIYEPIKSYKSFKCDKSIDSDKDKCKYSRK